MLTKSIGITKIKLLRVKRDFSWSSLSLKAGWLSLWRLAHYLPHQYAAILKISREFYPQGVRKILIPPPDKLSRLNLEEVSQEVLEKCRRGRVLDLREIPARLEAFQKDVAAFRGLVQMPPIEKIDIPGNGLERILGLLEILRTEGENLRQLSEKPNISAENILEGVINTVINRFSKLGFLNISILRPIEIDKDPAQCNWHEDATTVKWGEREYAQPGGILPKKLLLSIIQGNQFLYHVNIADPETFRSQGLEFDPEKIEYDLTNSIGPPDYIFIRLKSRAGIEAVIQLHNRIPKTEAAETPKELIPKEKKLAQMVKSELELYFRGAERAIDEIRKREEAEIIKKKLERPSQPQPAFKFPFSITNIKKFSLALLVSYYKLKIWLMERLRAIGAIKAVKQKINLVEYKNKSGERIVAIVDYPEGASKPSLAPWVIIPPAWGKRKETYFLLALYLKKNGIGVIRFDDTHGPGESDGEIIDATLSRSTENIIATLDFVSRQIRARKVALIPFSLSARPAIKVAASDKRVDFLFPVVGSPSLQSLLSNVYGEDLVGDHLKGRQLGVINMLGFWTDGDNFLKDATGNGYGDIASTEENMGKIGIPIVWYCGEQDPWVAPQEVRRVLAINPQGAYREVKIISGLTHRFREAETAHRIFSELTREISQQMLSEEITEVRSPSLGEVIERGMLERERITALYTREQEINRWENYLEGFDILLETDEYMAYLKDLRQAINLQPGERLLDAGCGTGNFPEFCLMGMMDEIIKEKIRGSGGEIIGVDLVEEALKRSREKAQQVKAKLDRLPSVQFLRHDIDVSHLKALERFIDGEFELEDLAQRLKGLELDLLAIRNRGKLRRFLRGEIKLEFVELVKAVGEINAPAVIELDRTCRFLRRKLTAEDLNGKGLTKVREQGFDYEKLDCSDLKLEHLQLDESTLQTKLPFQVEEFDKVLASLLLSYLHNPLDTLRELVTSLRKGGTIVVSTLKPDADISQIYHCFLEKVKKKYSKQEQEQLLDRARKLFNEAVGWIETEEESGRFRYFSEGELREMFEECGLKNIKIFTSFGNQGLIAVARKD